MSGSFLYQNSQNWAQHCRHGLTSAKQRGRITPTTCWLLSITNTAQDAVSCLCCKGTVVAHIQLVQMDVCLLFLGAPSSFSISSCMEFLCGIPLTLVGLHEILISLFLTAPSNLASSTNLGKIEGLFRLVPRHLHCKKYAPYVQSKSTPFYFFIFAPYPDTTDLGKKFLSVLYVHFIYSQGTVRCP